MNYKNYEGKEALLVTMIEVTTRGIGDKWLQFSDETQQLGTSMSTKEHIERIRKFALEMNSDTYIMINKFFSTES